jgi:hypothetical protein
MSIEQIRSLVIMTGKSEREIRMGWRNWQVMEKVDRASERRGGQKVPYLRDPQTGTLSLIPGYGY